MLCRPEPTKERVQRTTLRITAIEITYSTMFTLLLLLRIQCCMWRNQWITSRHGLDSDRNLYFKQDLVLNLYYILHIGAGAGKFLGVWRIFDRKIFGQLVLLSPNKRIPFFEVQLREKVFHTCCMLFFQNSAHLGAIFLNQTTLGAICARIFRQFAQIFGDFAKVFADFAQISTFFCSDFQGFFPDFQQIKTFWVHLHPLTPAPYTTDFAI